VSNPSCPQQPANSPEVEALFPDGYIPELRDFPISSLCSYGMTPTIMSGYLKHLLIQQFADPNNILNPAVRADMIRRGELTADNPSAMLITTLAEWLQGTRSESRPSLLIKPNAWEYDRVGIGNRSGGDNLTGLVSYYAQWRCSHTVFAIAAASPQEAQDLGTEVAKQLLFLSSVIEADLNLLRFVPASIGAVAKIKESTEGYVCPIDVAYVVQETWEIQPEAPKLKHIVFTSAQLAELTSQ